MDMHVKKRKVLFFVDRLRVGGIQVLLKNLFQKFPEEYISCELLLLDDGEHYELEDQISSMGIKIYKLKGIWLRKASDYLKYCKAVKKFFVKHHDYQAVHLNSGPKNYYILKCAKKYGISVRIAHSHNTGYQTSSGIQTLIGELFKKPLLKYSNVRLACSDYAGEWMFGKKAVLEHRVIVLPNGIDLDPFAFRREIRDEKRKELQVDNRIVIGHVGRFTTQKNHSFLIDIFQEIHRENSNTVLLLACIGENMEEIREKVKKLCLQDRVRFLGFRTDITELTQAMDVFLMPSLYEGFPVTGVEAQASGLPCVFSDTITREVKILDQIVYLPLQASPKEWAERTLELVNSTDREQSNALLRQKGYDIHDMIEQLLKLYGICRTR